MKINNSIINILPIKEERKTVVARRLNKFIKDPKGFLHGSYNKRSNQVLGRIPIKYQAKSSNKHSGGIWV